MRQRADAEPTRRLTVTGSDTRLAASSDGPTLSARHLVAAVAGTMLLTVLALAPRPQLPPAVNRLWPSADRNAMLAALDKVNARVRHLGLSGVDLAQPRVVRGGRGGAERGPGVAGNQRQGLQRAALPRADGQPAPAHGVPLYDSTFSRTVWRLCGGSKGLVM
jgi:hypothetical protein